MVPSTAEEFDEFQQLLKTKLLSLAVSYWERGGRRGRVKVLINICGYNSYKWHSLARETMYMYIQ